MFWHEKRKRREYLSRWPVTICRIKPEDGGGYHAYLPDYGLMGCCACGETEREALRRLREFQDWYFTDSVKQGLKIPAPSDPLAEEEAEPDTIPWDEMY